MSKCKFCETEITDEEEEFCHGCKTYVCSSCNEFPLQFGTHDPEDHLNEDEE